MTIDEAIKHCEEKAKQLEGYAEPYRSMGNCEKCAEEHRQLAEWLKELKQLREQTRWIPVSESSPADHNKDWAIVQIQENNGYLWIPCVAEYRKSKDDWFVPYENVGWLKGHNGAFKVIKWMPLPEPYKAERGE